MPGNPFFTLFLFNNLSPVAYFPVSSVFLSMFPSIRYKIVLLCPVNFIAVLVETLLCPFGLFYAKGLKSQVIVAISAFLCL